MVKMFKVELFVIEMNGFPKSINDLEQELECCTDNLFIKIAEIQETDIGEWNDDIKFNYTNTPIEEYRKEFQSENKKVGL